MNVTPATNEEFQSVICQLELFESPILPYFGINPLLFVKCFKRDPNFVNRKSSCHNSSLLMLVINWQRIEMYDLLIRDYKCNLNQQNKYGNTILHKTPENLLGCQQNNYNPNIYLINITRTMIDLGADVNIQNNKGKTALMTLFNYTSGLSLNSPNNQFHFIITLVDLFLNAKKNVMLIYKIIREILL